MNRELGSDNGNHHSPKLKKATKTSSPVQQRANDDPKINSNKAIGQRPRSAGFKSFLSWFKKVESSQRHDEVPDDDSESSSDSSEENSSSSSTATVASFSFLPPNKYKPYGEASQPEKFFSPGPYTETYHKLIQERNLRRNLDKNISLRKKYSLYSSGTISSKIDKNEIAKKKKDQNETTQPVSYDAFSLPSFSKLKTENLDEYKDSRKTASLSSRNVKTGSHVKGKRKAPLPPINTEYIKSYRKKRKAPPPPLVMPKSDDTEDVSKKENVQLGSPSPKSPLKDKKFRNAEEKGKKSPQIQNPDVHHEISPKPWYKRESKVKHNKNSSVQPDNSKKKKHEFPEVGFFRCTQIFENFRSNNNDKSESDSKNEKRVSRLLPNISELDREAAEIIKHHKSNTESNQNDVAEWNPDAVNKHSSARDLITKFNALSVAQTNVKINNQEIKLSNNNIIKGNSAGEIVPRANNVENKKIQSNFKENGNKASEKDITQAPVSPKNFPNEGDISKSFKAEIFSALPDLATAMENANKDAEANESRNKSTQDARQKLEELEEKIKLRELLKEMKNSLPKRPKIKQNAENDEQSSQNTSNTNEPSVADVKLCNDPKIIDQVTGNDQPKIIMQKPNELTESAVKTPENKYLSPKINNVYEKSSAVQKSTPVSTPFKITEISAGNDVKLQSTPVNNPSSSSKVSSFAQTSNILRKTEQTIANEKVQPTLSNNNSLYVNVNETNALRNFAPISLKTTPDNVIETVSCNNTNLLLKQLELAIMEGDDTMAAKLAKDLAMLKVNCSVTCSPQYEMKEIKWKRVNICIEDQYSHQGPLALQILETTKMGELKEKISKEFNIPTAAQRWIIGKQLADDDKVLLSHYNNNNFETPLFLYVITLEKSQIVQANKSKDIKTFLPSNINAVSNNILPKTETDKKNEILPISVQTPPPNNMPSKLVKNNNDETKSPVLKKSTPVVSKIDEKKPIQDGKILNLCNDKILKIKEPIINLKIEEKPVVIIPKVNPELKNVTKNTWICTDCTLINSLLSPLCSACGTKKPTNVEEYKGNGNTKNVPQEDNGNHYMQLVNLDNCDLILNMEHFDCSICLTNYGPQAGVMLRECLHTFCKECLKETIKYNEDAELKCPYRDENYFCDSIIQEREIKAIVGKKLYEIHLAKSIKFAETKIQNTFHCKTPDCKGWCIFDDNVNEFVCPVCKKNNCLTCQAIHEKKNCKEYQEEMNSSCNPSKSDGQQTKQMLDDMVKKGDAMICPSCKIVMMKKWGCDWVRCSMCKTEICWVTRGPRWGPKGKGDTSAGCQCGVNGLKCHPKCNYCH